MREDTFKSDEGGHLQVKWRRKTPAVECLPDSGCQAPCQPEVESTPNCEYVSTVVWCNSLYFYDAMVEEWLCNITLELTTLSSATLIIPAVAFGCTVPKSELSIDNFWQFWKKHSSKNHHSILCLSLLFDGLAFSWAISEDMELL